MSGLIKRRLRIQFLKPQGEIGTRQHNASWVGVEWSLNWRCPAPSGPHLLHLQGDATRLFGSLSRAQRSGDTLGGTILMGSRVYAPTIGRFLSIDPTPGGNANSYDYCTADPVNCTDLTGNWPDWGAVLNVVAVVAEVVATVVPGPIGTAAGFISAGAYLATGNTEKAAEMAITATAQLVGAGLAAKAAVKAVQYATKIGRAVTGTAKQARAGIAAIRESRAIRGIEKLPCNCFIAGTLVDTDHGPVPIEDIHEGDKVWTRNLDTDTNELHDVTGLFHKQATALMTITVTDGTTIVVTEEHPFHVDGEGWVLSGQLHPGDHLTQRNHTTTTITTITHTRRAVTVYNFEVTTTHNYYITTAQLLVHNCAVRANPLPKHQEADLAQHLGYRITSGRSKAGQRIYTNGKTYISQDVTMHLGRDATWKMAKTRKALNSKTTRMGTYDYLLRRMGG